MSRSKDNDAEPKTRTAFSVIETQFPDDVTKMKTEEFLDASQGVVGLVERFGKVFAPVTYDMNGNIRKLTEKYAEDQIAHEYLEDMILAEKEQGGLVAIDALLWLRRALNFLSVFFRSIVDTRDEHTEDLTSFIKNAYSETLERYHGWLGTQLFNVLSRFVPSRQNLLYKLALEQQDLNDQVLKDMDQYTTRMHACVQKLISFYEQNNLETDNRV